MQSYEILGTERLLEGHLPIVEATIRLTPTQGEPQTIKRVAAVVPDAAAVLIHRTDLDEFVLVRQFRYPAVAHGMPEMLEIVAGRVDGQEGPDFAAKREAEEETGYRPNMTVSIAKFFGSCGNLSELIHVYYAPVTAEDLKGPGGGIEDESIEIVSLPVAKALEMLSIPNTMDAKLLVALQWYALKFGSVNSQPWLGDK